MTRLKKITVKETPIGRTLWDCREYITVMAKTALGVLDLSFPLSKMFVKHVAFTTAEQDTPVGGLTGPFCGSLEVSNCLETEVDALASFSFLFHTVTLSRDNPMSDIYGANLYNNYLKSTHQNQVQAAVKMSPQAAGPQTAGHLELRKDCSNSVESCESILVCTGVYRHNADILSKREESSTETVFHGHRDFCFDPSLVEASYIVQDVNDAVQLAFKKENWS